MRKVMVWLCLALLLISADASAETQREYRNPASGYRAVILDEYDLLSDDEEQLLLETMIPITTYGNIAFYSAYQAYSQSAAAENARLTRRELFGTAEASIFAIDMKARYMYIQSYYGLMLDTITPSNAEVITNNVRGRMTRGQYFDAATEVYREILSLLQGNEILRPMKYLSNAAMAVMAGLLFSLLITIKRRKEITAHTYTPQYMSLTAVAAGAQAIVNTKLIKETVHQRYSPQDSGSSCSSCSSGSSCGGGGSSCSSCGGGGGSSF